MTGGSLARDRPQAAWLDALGQADAYAGWIFELLRPHLGPRTLEIGCGVGTYTALIAPQVAELVACDIDADFVRQARLRLAGQPQVRILQADATVAALGEAFDCVVMLDVLEHIADDRALLERLIGLLRPGGTLVLKVPAGQWLMSPLDHAVGHHRRYSRQALGRLLERAGFEVLVNEHFARVAALGWFVSGRLLRRRRPSGWQLKVFDRLLPAIRLAERALPLPFGLAVICAARRPPGDASPRARMSG